MPSVLRNASYYLRPHNLMANKVVLLGDYGVGKTSLFYSFMSETYVPDEQKSTRAECVRTWIVDGAPITITLQDTAGMERYASTLPPTYFRNCKVALFVYSVDNQESMDNIEHWVASINPIRIKGHTDEVCRAIVGTKIDRERVVSAQRANNVAEQLHIDQSLIFEVNALTGQGVQEMFNKIAKHMKTSSTSMETIDIINAESDKKTCSC